MAYKASKDQSQGREGWCIIFRHPLRRDKDGKPLRVRRGLRTKDADEAEKLVQQMNGILQNESLWTLAAKERATREMDQRIVSMFYDDIEIKYQEPWALREKVIPLRGHEQGYTSVQLIGSTGAGKTTLLRQLIGSDPTRDRFPSTSTAKTTVFDTEIMTSESPYRAVVSFMPGDQVRKYIEDCVIASISAAADGASQQEILRKLLEHTEQRFRLSYVLGNIHEAGSDSTPELKDEDDEDDTVTTDETVEISEQEHAQLESRLRGFLNKIISISEMLKPNLAKSLSEPGAEEFADIKTLKSGERDAFEELLEEVAIEDETAQLLIDEIFDEVESKFSQIQDGTLDHDRTGWPEQWYFECEDRPKFIKAVNRFSGNHWTNFGHLLTPVVIGMRVAGPFKPDWIKQEDPKLVLIDGEGIGHTSSTMVSLPSAITRRYGSTDVILLVDNATQPMQAGAEMVLRSVCSGGYEPKLAIVFTHFDLIHADNFTNQTTRKNLLWASLDNIIHGLDRVFSFSVSRSLKRELEPRVFFVSKINESLSPNAKATISELEKLLKVFKDAIPLPLPTEPIVATPVYNIRYLTLNAQFATKDFHKRWMALLGLAYESGIPAQHWARIKALSRRFAETGWSSPEYDVLRPVADLAQLLEDKLYAFVSVPQIWKPKEPSEDEKREAIARMKHEVSDGIYTLVADLLYALPRKEWISAWEQSGTGSTRVRSGKIRDIYQMRTPLLTEVPSPEVSAFLESAEKMFQKAAKQAGAEII